MNSQRTKQICLFEPSLMISSPANWKNTSKLTFSLIYSDNSNVCNTPNIPLPGFQRVKAWSERWPSDRMRMCKLRAYNKERILHALIQKIENAKIPAFAFILQKASAMKKNSGSSANGGTISFHLAINGRKVPELNRFLAIHFPWKPCIYCRVHVKGMPFFATPYYLSLLNCTGSGYNDDSLRSHIPYSPQLVETYGTNPRLGTRRHCQAGKPDAAGWLLPDGHNIHRRS